MTFGKNLKKIRKEKKLTQEMLASMIGVNVYTIKMWEGDHFEPNTGNLRAVCSALGCRAEDLIGGKTELTFDVPADRVAFIDEVMTMPDDQLERVMRYYELIKKAAGANAGDADSLER